MKKVKIVLAIVLCLAFILPLFASCGNSDDKKDDGGSTTAAAEDSSSETTPTEAKDPDAPDLPVTDMDGKTFTVLTAGWGVGSNLAKDVGAEEQTGDPIDDAAFDRRVKLEQLYNCKIKQINEEDNTEAVNKYRTSILAGDGSYDFAITTCSNFTSLLSGNLLLDLNQLTHVDMDKPYWDRNFYDSMSILGKNFAASGDISKRRLECVWIMCFNKKMITDNQLESPYDLVKNGQWTYDKMHEMGKHVAKDLNGDSVMTLEDDLWGINYTGDTIMGIINSSGVKIAEVNSDGIPELTIGLETNLEKLLRIYTEMRDHTYSIDTLFMVGGGLTGLGDVDLFAENRCLFLACASHNVRTGGENNTNSLRQMDVEFGIIPYPKWDLSQPDYTPYTAGNYHPVISVPSNNDDIDNTSIILEAMAYEGRKTITPAFYESLLKTKTARDVESLDMLDFIFGNLSYDIGNMYNFGEITGVFGYAMSTNIRQNVVSTITRESGKWQKAIDNLVTEIEKGE